MFFPQIFFGVNGSIDGEKSHELWILNMIFNYGSGWWMWVKECHSPAQISPPGATNEYKLSQMGGFWLYHIAPIISWVTLDSWMVDDGERAIDE